MEDLKTAAMRKVEEAYPHAEAAIQKAKEKGEDVWERAKHKGENILEDLQLASRETLNQTKTFIQKHPGQAVGYAVLLGAFLGFLCLPKGRA